jgi:hypothetical protein
VPSFWSEQYDLYIQSVGWPAHGRTRVHRALGCDPSRRSGEAAKADNQLVFEIAGGCVAYATGINAQRDLAAARRLIERRVPVDPAALADPAQPLAAMLKRSG